MGLRSHRTQPHLSRARFSQSLLGAFLGLLAVGGLSGCSSIRPRSEVCDSKVVFKEGSEFTINKNAEKLICGDPDLPSWKDIPPSQKKLMLADILRKEGFHRADFRIEGDRLFIDPGMRSRIHRLKFLDPPDEFFDYLPPEFEGRPLTAANLDAIEQWARRRLHEIGYPCSRVESLASLEDQQVLVKLFPGPKKLFPETLDHVGDSLIRAVESRYRAFFPGEVYQQSLLKLSSERMELDGVASRSTYAEQCSVPMPGDQVAIQHQSSLGPPRAVQIGFGFSTEELFLVRASWKNLRLGRQASLVGVTLNASFIEQKLIGYANKYLTEKHPRLYLAPKISLQHTKEEDQEYYRIQTPLFLGWSNEWHRGQLAVELGPNFNYERVLEGPVVGRKRLILGDSQWYYRSHPFEYFLARPSEGFDLQLNTSSILYSFERPAQANSIQLRGTWLWNMGSYDPARYVFGVRGKIRSVLKDGRQETLDVMPVDYFSWLGGEDDLRGFGRKELPVDRNGTLTSAYLGTEFRAPVYFAESLDPLLLADFGWLGNEGSFNLDSTLYYAVGTGLRWQSPIGSVRTTAAHGFISDDGEGLKKFEHWQFFISLGREF